MERSEAVVMTSPTATCFAGEGPGTWRDFFVVSKLLANAQLEAAEESKVLVATHKAVGLVAQAKTAWPMVETIHEARVPPDRPVGPANRPPQWAMATLESRQARALLQEGSKGYEGCSQAPMLLT